MSLPDRQLDPGPRGAGQRLWIFNHYATPPDRPGGTRHYDLAAELAGSGWDVTIFAAGFSHVTGREERLRRRQLYRVQQRGPVRFVWLRTPRYRGNGAGRALNMLAYAVVATVVQWRLPRPTVVIGSSVHLLAALAGLAAARMRGARFVMEVRDVWPQALVDAGALRPEGLAARAMHGLADYLYRRAARIIVVVAAAADLITARGIPRDRIVVIPHAARRPDAGPGSADLAGRAWYRQLTEVRRQAGTVIMYVGALGTANALDEVVSAARSLEAAGRHDIHLVFIGEGPERPTLERASREVPIVHYLGPIQKSEVAAALTIADAGLATMIRGPWDSGVSMNKIADYFGASRPVIMLGSPRDNPVLEARAGQAVDYGDVAGLRDAMVEMAELGPEGREALGRNGRRYADEHLDLERLAERLSSIIS